MKIEPYYMTCEKAKPFFFLDGISDLHASLLTSWYFSFV